MMLEMFEIKQKISQLLQEQMNIRQKLKREMTGTLYPSILGEEYFKLQQIQHAVDINLDNYEPSDNRCSTDQ